MLDPTLWIPAFFLALWLCFAVRAWWTGPIVRELRALRKALAPARSKD